MNSTQKANTLAAYVRQGGNVWLVGNAATASMINFDRTLNNNTQPAPATLTFRNTDNELTPGRFGYEQAHWRSEFKQYKVNGGKLKRYLGRFESNPGVYGLLPAEIQLKTAGTDPFPPNRSTTSPSVFYQTQFDVEFLSAANEILEDLNPGPAEDFRSTLDTLYKVTASSLQPDTGPGALQSVVMTHYHGLGNQEFLLTGFNIWNFKRVHCKALVDFVLQQMWHFPAPVPASASFTRPVAPGMLSAGPSRASGAAAKPGAAPGDAGRVARTSGGSRE
jgi:hypothetical protein